LSLEELESDEAVLDAIKEKILKAEPGISLKMMTDHLEVIHAHTLRKMLSFEMWGTCRKN